ncbi:alpha/beta hydrolase [Saccharopolyspora sp. NPDC002376]
MSFDPRDTKANPGTIRSAAGDLEAVSGSLTGHGQSVGNALRTTAKSFSDLISSRITSQAAYNESACQTAVSTVIFGQAVTGGWADDVEWFKREREKLIKQWDDASDSNFGVKKPELAKVPADEKQEKLNSYDSKVASAKSAKLDELNKKAADLWERFQDKASTRGNQLTNGPTPEALHQLDAAGLLPLAATSLFGGDWTPARPHALLANMISKGVLLASFADMTAKEIAHRLDTDHALAARLAKQAAMDGTGDALMQSIWNLDHKGGNAGDVSKQFDGLSEEQRTWYALLAPGVFGAGAGLSKAERLAPFDMRATSNRVRISGAIDGKNAKIAELKAKIAKLEEKASKTGGYNPYGAGYNMEHAGLLQQIQDAKAELKAAETRQDTYQELLDDKVANYGAPEGAPDKVNRKIILFDPSTGKDGGIAELTGNITKNTKSVGVLVPGTTTNTDNFTGNVGKSESFVKQSPNGSLAMITWSGGEQPDVVNPFSNPHDNATQTKHADKMGPDLATFSHELRSEVGRVQGDDNGTKITYGGHSYGGATVGTAEQHGLDADRVLHIESAGMSEGVHSPDDLPKSQENVHRYSMTAPGDPIGIAQGAGDLHIGHGADPDDFKGTTHLSTGRYPNTGDLPADKRGEVIEGGASHSDVFTPYSEAWQNMYNVYTGGDVKLYEQPDMIQTPTGYVQDREHVYDPNYRAPEKSIDELEKP